MVSPECALLCVSIVEFLVLKVEFRGLMFALSYPFQDV